MSAAALLQAQDGLRRYSVVFFCPVSAHCKLGGDPARVPDLAYQRVYDAVLWGLLLRLAPESTPVVVLGSGDLEVRMNTVMAAITSDTFRGFMQLLEVRFQDTGESVPFEPTEIQLAYCRGRR